MNEGYKSSGVDWIGKIPVDWEVRKLKFLTTPRKELSTSGEEELLSVTENRGIVKRKTLRGSDENLTRSESLEGYRIVKKGDLVSNIMLVWKRGLGVSSYEGIVSPAYSVFTFESECHPKYFNYLLRSEEFVTEFRRNSKGITMSVCVFTTIRLVTCTPISHLSKNNNSSPVTSTKRPNRSTP